MSEIICCIYCIENIVNEKKYIGQTIDFNSRVRNHKSKLRTNKSQNRYLQNAWNKYGETNFIIYILEKCLENELDELEKFYINKFESNKKEVGYNINSGGSLNRIVSKDTRERISRRLKGLSKSIEHKLKIGLGNKNKKISDEQIEKMSKPRPHMRGYKNPNFGKTWDEEKRKTMSLERLGIKYGLNPYSEFHGVGQEKITNKYGKIYFYWRVRIVVNKKLTQVGNFKKEIDAARAYDKYVVENSLPNPLNFPEDYPERGDTIK